RDPRMRADDPHWGEDGTIVFRDQTGIWTVKETGGDAALVLEGLWNRPSMLPDGSGILYTTPSFGLAFLDLSTGETADLVGEAVDPLYVHTGHIVYGHPTGGLFALGFDLSTHTVTGAPLPLLDEVLVSGPAAHFDVSANGTLVFTSGAGDGAQDYIVVLGPSEAVDTIPLEAASFDQVRFSPDGRSLSFNTRGGIRSDDRQVWIFDLVRESQRQLSFDGGHRAVWSPDGDHLAYSSEGPGTAGEDLWVHPTDGGSDPRHLDLGIPGDEHAAEWPLDTALVFESAGDLWVVNPFADSVVARPYGEAEYTETDFDLDPTGRFAAYTSDEYGRLEIFVRDFPTPSGKWRISAEGGSEPRWSADGRYLYYESLDGSMIMRTEVQVDAGVTPIRTEVAWRSPEGGRWDLDRNTGRAVATVPVQAGDSGPNIQLWVVVNWFEELRARTGGGGSQ
ncbi:MAG: hypothetical protein O3A47_12450, partial [Chloroflexi bacterium]|nr:hypothetical protein [Chloroflexota bacterium]